MKPQTGEPVWTFDMAKRGINTAVVMNGIIKSPSYYGWGRGRRNDVQTTVIGEFRGTSWKFW